MAKLLTERDFQRRHNENVELYVRRIQRLYNKLAKNAALISSGIKRPKLDRLFSFDDYKSIESKINEELKSFHDEFLATLKKAVITEIALANTKNDYIVRSILSEKASESTNSKAYFARNKDAFDSFQNRKINGLNLSDRVWKLTDQFKVELELALDNSILTGRSASATATDIKKYLNNPDKIFRRVRNDRGDLVASKASKAFRPGQGVYKSSFKNAERVVRTEVNSAYQSADYHRIQQMNFIVGIRVHRSNNPFPCKLCDSAKGDFPVTYRFTMRHQNCRCFTTNILMTDDEINKLNDAIIEGRQIDFISVNKVNDVPKSFTDYIKENAETISKYKSSPLFTQYNFVDNNILKGLKPF